jgi:hypothetical protein
LQCTPRTTQNSFRSQKKSEDMNIAISIVKAQSATECHMAYILFPVRDQVNADQVTESKATDGDIVRCGGVLSS